MGPAGNNSSSSGGLISTACSYSLRLHTRLWQPKEAASLLPIRRFLRSWMLSEIFPNFRTLSGWDPPLGRRSEFPKRRQTLKGKQGVFWARVGRNRQRLSLLQVPLVWVGQQMVSAQISLMTGQCFMSLCALVYHLTPALFSSLESSKKGMTLMLKHAEKGMTLRIRTLAAVADGMDVKLYSSTFYCIRTLVLRVIFWSGDCNTQ